MHELVDFSPERTEYADEAYAVVGRALTYAAIFERDSKNLAALIEIKKRGAKLKFDEAGELVATWTRLRPLGAAHGEIIDLLKAAIDLISDRLGAAHNGIIDGLGIPEPRLTLSDGREARNCLAHTATVGLQSRIDHFDNRAAFIREIKDAVEKIAGAHVVVLTLTCALTNEDVPTTSFLDAFPVTVSQWVCEV